MQKTANYGLNKPELTDNYDVTDQNTNMDVIDTKLKELESNSSIDAHVTDTVVHITSEERDSWNAKIDSSGGTVNGKITTKELEVSDGHLEMSGDISYIDFHFGGDMSVDFTTRIIEYSKGQIEIINGVDQGKRLLINTDKLTESNSVLHTGNSVPVVVSTTAPADTTAVWIVPS